MDFFFAARASRDFTQCHREFFIVHCSFNSRTSQTREKHGEKHIFFVSFISMEPYWTKESCCGYDVGQKKNIVDEKPSFQIFLSVVTFDINKVCFWRQSTRATISIIILRSTTQNLESFLSFLLFHFV